MSRAKTERLVNLTMALMATRRLLTVSEIGRLIEGYEPDDTEAGGEAFRRMFERDKEELRELGIPLQAAPIDPLHGDEIGYRIVRSDYALPELALDPEEAAALGLAARFWSSARLSAAAESALRKLAAGGLEPLAPPGLEARVEASEPAFDPLFAAVLDRNEVGFSYRRPGAQATVRRLQPWGLVSWHGRWYVGGHDLDRNETRVFRLSRITGPVTMTSPPDAYVIPPDADVRTMVTAAYEGERRATRTALIRLAPGTGNLLRNRSRVVPGPADTLEIDFVSLHGFADMVAAYGPDAVVLAPAELRALVVARLRAFIGAENE